MASGGLTMLNKDKLEPLKDYKIILHPDKGDAFLTWTKRANEWTGYSIVISRITEDNPEIPDKGDLADYYLRAKFKIKNKVVETEKMLEKERDEIRNNIVYSEKSIEIHRQRTELSTKPSVTDND
jgi:hypothetical protein